MGILSLSLGESKGAGERERERERGRDREKGKKVRKERVEGEPRRIEKRSHRQRCVCERGRHRQRVRETTDLYRTQSTNKPRSEQARKSEKIGLRIHQFFLSLQGIRIERMAH